MWSVQEPHWLASVLGIVATVGVPVAFLVGLLRERLTYASVAGLVRSMDRLPVEQIEPTLARVLRDPSLRLMFAVDDGYLDPLGRAVSPPASGAGSVTVLGDADAPVAVLVHDPALNDEPELLQGAAAAIRLALENARLHAEVKDQLAQVRASRARLVGAADAARRRLERDLHDGAQQRLVTAGLALRLLRQRLPGPANDDASDDNARNDNARNNNARDDDARELLAEAEAELRQAIVELRELARGIHPAILTDQGLRAAVDQLALRCPVPITVTGDPGRAPTEVESTAYFVVSEALTNAIRHAQAGRVTIDLVRAEDRLAVTVTDDGIGGADPAAGSGLTGLADRVASIDGRLTIASQPNAGTQLHVELPCA